MIPGVVGYVLLERVVGVNCLLGVFPPILLGYGPLVSKNNLSLGVVALTIENFETFFCFALAYIHPGQGVKVPVNLMFKSLQVRRSASGPK